MKFRIAFAALAAIAAASVATADTYVSGYTKKDGTVVQGYYKTDPNNTKTDNYSSKGNVNPYTGKEGTKDPYKYEPYKPKK